MPRALVDATVRAAAAEASGNLASCVVSGATASLVERALWSMAMIKIKTAMVGLALVGVVGFGATLAIVNGRAGRAQTEGKTKGNPPRSDELKDPEGTALVYNEARDQQTILAIVPTGSVVKKGDVVCELDSAELRDSLTNQQIASSDAQRGYRASETAREIAEMNFKEYTEFLYKIQLAEVLIEVAKAEDSMAAAGETKESDGKRSGPQSRRLAQLALELAQSRRQALLFGRDKRIKELRVAIENAQIGERTSKALWERELSKEKRIAREIEVCTMVAPRDGKLVYYYGPAGSKPRVGWKADGSTAPWPYIEIGAQVQPRQLLFKIEPVPEPANPSK